jgi:antibiotic biosynthesis monooxygenase (ABM) superfamily enzyme
MDQATPVTVVVRHRVKPGKEPEFEEWRRGISHAALQFEGHRGFTVVRPAAPEREYLFLFRFDTLEHLEKWEGSATRREWLERLDHMTAEPVSRERHTGMEVWFTPPPGRRQAPRYKMVAVTLLALYPLVSLVQWLLAPLLVGWPPLLRTLVSAVLLVVIMTYVAMPLLTWLFARWLYKPPQGKPEPGGAFDKQ